MSIYLSYGGMITPLGNNVEENFQSMREGKSGVRIIENSGVNGENWPLGKIASLDTNRFNDLLTRLCKAVAKNFSTVIESERTLIIVSSTKANINELPGDTFQSIRSIIDKELNPVHKPVIISNACISGVLAINTASDYINSGKYENILAIGIDAISDFIVYGFQSLFALSNEPSKPFDKNRKGISIGEAAAAILVQKEQPENRFSVEYLGGASSNDANHISGPSRTGEGLFRAVNNSMKRANVSADEIDFISAHGTGTLYNDEMESIAFERLGLDEKPMNSMKGYFGHTLGAAGIVEIISTMKMMEHGIMLKSLGFEEQGTTRKINVLSENKEQSIQKALKTASGFGGGNAALILRTINES